MEDNKRVIFEKLKYIPKLVSFRPASILNGQHYVPGGFFKDENVEYFMVSTSEDGGNQVVQTLHVTLIKLTSLRLGMIR